MKFLKYLLAAALALVGAGSAHAQTCIMTFSIGMNYTQYSSMAYSYSTNNLHTSVLTDGSASMTPNISGNCPPQAVTSFQNSLAAATHQVQVYNKVAAQGAWENGPTLCATCWNSFENDQIYTAPGPGVGFIWYQQSRVFCSAAGTLNFIGANGKEFNIWDYVEVAYTKSVRSGPSVPYTQGKVHGYMTPVTDFCDIAHYPPDARPRDMKTALASSNYFASLNPCLRLVAPGPWVCFYNATDFPNATDLPSPQFPGACTKTP